MIQICGTSCMYLHCVTKNVIVSYMLQPLPVLPNSWPVMHNYFVLKGQNTGDVINFLVNISTLQVYYTAAIKCKRRCQHSPAKVTKGCDESLLLLTSVEGCWGNVTSPLKCCND